MDEAFEEEKRNLAGVLKEIDHAALSLEQAAEQMNSEINEMFQTGNDYRSAIERRDARYRQKLKLADAAGLRQLASEPYYARLDFDVDQSGQYDTATFYIGRHGSFSDVLGRQLIWDWRSSLGDMYRQKTQRKFQINDCDYLLLLRRALEIQHRELISCSTEYDAGADVSLDGEIVDPFLLEVLKDKRRHPRLTDIIRTIQENQNNILLRPANESFALQGCAGSGKTMIMLHRLSYLKFNNPGTALSTVKIITPNRQFSEHIHELCDELDLQGIARMTIAEYYNRLIRLYHRDSPTITTIRSEKSLPEKMLERIYSLSFARETADAYHALWEATLSELRGTGLDALARRLGKSLPDIQEHDDEAYRLLAGRLRSIKEQAEASRNQLQSAKWLLDQTSAEIASVRLQISETHERLIDGKKQAAEALSAELASAETRLYENNRQKERLKTAVETAKEDIKSLTADLNLAAEQLRSTTPLHDELTNYVQYRTLKTDTPVSSRIAADCQDLIRTTEENHVRLKQASGETAQKHQRYTRIRDNARTIFASIDRNRASYLDPDGITGLPQDDTVRGILEYNLSAQIQACKSLQQQLKSTPAYSFIRHSRLSNELQAARNQYQIQAETLLNTYRSNLSEIVGNARADLEAAEQVSGRIRADEDRLLQDFQTRAERLFRLYCDECREKARRASEKIAELEALTQDRTKKGAELDRMIRQDEQAIAALQHGLTELRDNEIPDFSLFKASEQAALGQFISGFIGISNEYLAAARKANQLERNLPPLQQECDALEAAQLNESEAAALDRCEQLVDSLSYQNIVSRIEEIGLNQVYAESGHKPSQYHYHHQIYLQLLYHTLYYRKPTVPDRFLCIDEAQDIAVSEYRLLEQILGENCVFNLYGDVNQSVYRYKGIQDWAEDIPGITHGNVFLLNENYRNTIQVTDYCNESFGTEMTAIGIGGDDVRELPMAEAIAWIIDKKSAHREARACVIYRQGAERTRQRIRDELEGKFGYEYGASDNNKISLITVEMAKGLEFEYAVIATDQMSENERYVSCTRAIEALTIITA